MSLNAIHLIGNVGQDAELKYSAEGKPRLTFNLAVNERNDETTWFNVVLFGDRAEKLGQHITKGKQMYVGGRIRTRSWEADGVKHYRTEVIAFDIQFLDRKQQSSEPDDLPWE